MVTKCLAALASVLMGVVILSAIGAMWTDVKTPENIFEWILGYAGSGMLLMAAVALPVGFYKAITQG